MRSLCGSLARHLVLSRTISKARYVGLELELNRSRGTVTLLANDYFGQPMSCIGFSLPFRKLTAAFRRFLVLKVVLLAEHEQHHVGVLFDRARFTQIGELRALVVAVLDLARQLRQRDDRDRQFLAERLK